MGKQGRLREKQRRQGQKRLDATREWRKPILSWDPPEEWVTDGEDVEVSDRACEERVSAT